MNAEHAALRRTPSAQTDRESGPRAVTARTTQLTALATALNATPRAQTLQATIAALNTPRPAPQLSRDGRAIQRMMEDEQPAEADAAPMTAADMRTAVIGEVVADTEEDEAYIREVFDSQSWMQEHLDSLADSEVTRADFDTDDRDHLVRELLGALRAYEQAESVAPSGGGSGGSWARKSTRSRAAALAEQGDTALFPDGRYTIHHKVSQSRLKTLAERLTSAHQDARFSALVNKDGAGSLEKGLLNLPANLEVGPRGETRGDDPGAEFDPNLLPDGAMTPRSSRLNEVDGFITGGETDWNRLFTILEGLAQQREITEPKEAQWRPVRGKWHRGPG